jgi:hypothetical protein
VAPRTYSSITIRQPQIIPRNIAYLNRPSFSLLGAISFRAAIRRAVCCGFAEAAGAVTAGFLRFELGDERDDLLDLLFERFDHCIICAMVDLRCHCQFAFALRGVGVKMPKPAMNAANPRPGFCV